MKKKNHYIHIIIFLLPSLVIWACVTDYTAAPKQDHSPKEKVNEVSNISIIILYDWLGDSITMHPNMGIFANEDSAKLRYVDVANEFKKSLAIDIRKIDIYNISQDKRKDLFNNGIIAIHRANPKSRRKGVIFFQNSSTDQIYQARHGKLFETNWAGRYLLKKEIIDIEILTNQGEVIRAQFNLDYKDPKNPKRSWGLFKQDGTHVRYDDQDEFILIKKKAVASLNRFCVRRDLSHIFPQAMCKRPKK